MGVIRGFNYFISIAFGPRRLLKAVFDGKAALRSVVASRGSLAFTLLSVTATVELEGYG